LGKADLAQQQAGLRVVGDGVGGFEKGLKLRPGFDQPGKPLRGFTGLEVDCPGDALRRAASA
jgi:hypothetical protein